MCHPSPSPTSIKNAAREKLDFFSLAIFCDNKGRRIPKAPTLPSFILCRRIYAPTKAHSILLLSATLFPLRFRPRFFVNLFVCCELKRATYPIYDCAMGSWSEKRLEPHRAGPGDKVRISVVLGLMHHHDTSRVPFFISINFFQLNDLLAGAAGEISQHRTQHKVHKVRQQSRNLFLSLCPDPTEFGNSQQPMNHTFSVHSKQVSLNVSPLSFSTEIRALMQFNE